MAGICGVIQFRGVPRLLSPRVLERMANVLAHRGPVAVQRHLSEGVALAARVRAGDAGVDPQPYSGAGGAVRCVVDGELYDGTTRGLEGVPELYEQAGTALAEHLRGKFAIALWDERSRTAMLVRDRLGIKPLYVAIGDDQLVFASELKGVLASGLVDPELDYEAIDAYLTLGYVPTPRTVLKGVSKLSPGTRLVADGGGTRIERFWSFPRPAPEIGVDEREHAERLLAALEESVRLHLMGADQATAVLSGGLDSSFVVALLARNTTKPVQAFTVGFAEAGEHNEIDDARFVSDTFGAEHHQLELSQRERSVDLEDLIWHLDEPLADLSSMGLFALSAHVARHGDAVFTGQGSDQLFGGYRKHSAASIVGYWRRIPGATTAARALPERLIPARYARVAHTLGAGDPAARLVAMSGRASAELKRTLARNELAAVDGRAAERAARSRLDGMPDDPLAAALYLDAQLELVDDMLHYFDRATMAHALEVRIPFLDHPFVELTSTIPAALKVKRLRNKHVLRVAAEGILPARVISDKEKKKIGFFHSAVDSWFRNQVSGAVSDYLLSGTPASAAFLDETELQSVVRQHLAGTETDDTYGLFAILMLEVWLSSYLPRAISKPT